MGCYFFSKYNNILYSSCKIEVLEHLIFFMLDFILIVEYLQNSQIKKKQIYFPESKLPSFFFNLVKTTVESAVKIPNVINEYLKAVTVSPSINPL